MKLFLDTSVLLAASGSAKGASRAVFHFASEAGWTLISSPYVLNEVVRNLSKLPVSATKEWIRLRRQLDVVDDVITSHLAVVFSASKDRPVLLTALASSDFLLTLARDDFAKFLGSQFYGLNVRIPSEFLAEQRSAGRLRISE